MKTLISEERFLREEGNAAKLMKKVCDAVTDGETDIYIYVVCEGGEVNEIIRLVNFIKDIEDKGVKIHLIGETCLLSAGLMLFLLADCTTKKVLPFTRGMTHLGDRYSKLGESKVNGTASNFDLKELEYINNRTFELERLCGLPEEKIKEEKNNKEVWLNTNEVIELIENSKKYKNLINVCYGLKPDMA